MELNNKYSWIDKFRKGVGRVVLGASLLFGVTVVEAVPGFSVDLEGCDGAKTTIYEGKMVNDIHPEHDDYMMYFCDAYTDGNLGTWAELDMVPNDLIVKNDSGSDQNFTLYVGGEYNTKKGYPGWDYITELTLNVEETIAQGGDPARCKEVGKLSVQDIDYIDDGKGTTYIFRKVEVEGFPDGLVCVPTYNIRLALGSSINSGSSLHSILRTHIDGAQVGTKALPISQTIPNTLSKSMTAVAQNTGNTWTIEKEATPATIDFGDTCDESVSLEGDVQITVTWTKIPTNEEDKVRVATVITATNAAKRPIDISVLDTLYGNGKELDTATCQAPLPANETVTVCTNIFDIDPLDAVDLNDKAVATYIDPDHSAGINTTLEATAAATVTPGTSTETNATIREHEYLTGNDLNNLSYSLESVSGIGGTISPNTYTLGDITTGDMYWISDPQSESGEVVFNKKVYVEKATIATGTLKDEASVDGIVGAEVSAFVNLVATKRLEVTLTKEITEPRDTDTDFSFEVRNPSGFDRLVTLTVPAGETSVSEIYADVEPVRYNVKEVPQPGWEPANDDNATKIVDLTGEVCTGSASFINQRADRFIDVKVRKVTYPETIESEDQSGGWTMTLSRETSPGSGTWDVVETKDTVAGAWVILANQDNLTAGSYKIEETMKDGWYNVGVDRDCTFTYDGDPERQDFECIYANAKEGKIVITKEIDGDTSTKFGFTQTIDNDALTLSGGESKTYENLTSGTYRVTENDPGENFVLSSLSCVESISNSIVDIHLGTVAIQLDPGETVECTFRNIELKDEPSIDIEKLTNGEDADEETGPLVLVGDAIRWEYIVTNNGNIDLNNIAVTDDIEGPIICPLTTLNIGESMICVHNGIATLGQYENVGTVTSDKDDDNDTSHYLGFNENVDPEDNETVCPCNDVESDSSSALNTVTSALMILMTLMLGLFFVRREELNTNEK